ncbi:phage/plasmid primase, P4 family [Candidatus Thioglobus autotrophicus]|uniref:phage/plasmid primase, P4 family n=1 Tax=Candidatus Thioglobus autotrophicus TaxID=1705394 RepID=UPI00299EB49D|nr:phage/plasmid primase, P4 family [Candidatus Thioglobus autotrophicus]WPE18696.1 phage/plasmid primase, P4 family [Candidatus Thioglobus autotrophicus]
MSHIKDVAIGYTSNELKIFPCVQNEKRPLTKHGFKDASSERQAINNWWNNHPNANIGLPTGKVNNLVVIDVDVKNNASGMNSLKQLQDEHGQFDTKMVHTPSGGLHYYFSYPNGVDVIKNRVNMKPGIDIRADDGYVVAPGSCIDGNYYKFKDKNKEIAKLPKSFLEALFSSNLKTSIGKIPTSKIIHGVDDGARDIDLFRYAAKLRAEDMEYEDAKILMFIASNNCRPPTSQSKAIKCLNSAWKYEVNFHLTELGNAKRLVDKYNSTLKYVVEFKRWLVWGGNRWIFDETGEVYRLAKKTALGIYDESANTSDDNKRQALAKFAVKSESQRSLDALIKLAKTEKGIPLRVNDLDKNPYLLGVNNGVINLKTGGLRINTELEFITKQAPVTFNPDATCPKWISFLDQAMNGDKDMIEYLQRITGYSLTGITTEQKLFFLYGFGANGKSVFVNTIQDLLGDYAMQTPVSTLMTKNKGSINNDVARLRGARFVATTETEEHSKFNESEVKQLTGGDTITARFLNQEFFEFRPEFKLWISGNHKPIPGDGYGIWRRLILIPFDIVVEEKNRDRNLPNKLREELPGILNWAIDGCLKWQEDGLKTPQKILTAIKEYKTEMDTVQNWIDDCWDSNPNPNLEIKAAALYSSYKYWAEENGEYYKMTQRALGQKLKERGIEKTRKNSGIYYKGVRVNNVDF